MIIKLPSGVEIKLGVHHCHFRLPNVVPLLRGMKITITFPDGADIEGSSICKPPDQFCKRTGRRLAANRLLAGLRRSPQVLHKADRKAIFAAICPEYFKLKTERWWPESLKGAGIGPKGPDHTNVECPWNDPETFANQTEGGDDEHAPQDTVRPG